MLAFRGWSHGVQLSHGGGRPPWLCHTAHSSMVKHLLICNKNFVWAWKYVSSLTTNWMKTQREKETHFVPPSERAEWHKRQHCSGHSPTSSSPAWCWTQRSGSESSLLSPTRVSLNAIWPTVTAMWLHQALDQTLYTGQWLELDSDLLAGYSKWLQPQREEGQTVNKMILGEVWPLSVTPPNWPHFNILLHNKSICFHSQLSESSRLQKGL